MKIKDFKPDTREPGIPKPDKPAMPHVVTVQDGVPVRYPGSDAVGVRVVHPSNPKAYTEAMGIVMFYLPPHAALPIGSHWTEETYCILKGHGVMTLAGTPTPVGPGSFVHLPPWCEHGIENTGNEGMEVLLCTVPPNP
ncbi:MAG: cupin domain-containing protein [Chloroflexi bacterium]|nr:cupin domain-containing protein [Chloroflexota bacterium]